MFENLTTDDIITAWSEQVLADAIAGRPSRSPVSRFELHIRLSILNETKRPLAQLRYGG